MAHFAKIENGIVTEVLVVPNEQESRGQEFLAEDLGLGGTWVQTSYNSNFGGKFAGIGDTWDGTVFTTPIDETLKAESEAKQAAREAALAKLGLTADELKTLLG